MSGASFESAGSSGAPQGATSTGTYTAKFVGSTVGTSTPPWGERPRFALVALILTPVLALMAWHAWSVYWQCDDAFISFRYVWHVVQGNGLVFNPGERVEGYTNFLWVLELSAIWKWLGVPPEVACNWLSAFASIGAVAVTIAMAFRAPARHRRLFVAFGALLLLATSRTWAVWCTSGLETRQFTLFTLLGVYLVGTGRGRPGRLALASLAFVGAEYTRPEGPLLWAFAGAWLLVEMAIARKFSLRDCLAYGVPLVVLVGAHFVWRHSYYGEWLPNTYYAKFVRPWPEAGLRYYAAGAIESGAWFLIPFAIVGAVSRARRGDRTHFLGAAVVGAHVYYLVQIGGDHFELRPLDFYWPLLMLASVEGMLATGEAIAAQLGGGSPARTDATTKSATQPTTAATSALSSSAHGSAKAVMWSVAGVLLALGVLYGSIVQSAKIDYCRQFETRDESHFLYVKLDRENSPFLFSVPPMAPLVGLYDEWQAYALRHGVGTVWREHEVFWRDELANWKPYERVRGKRIFPPDAVAARGSIGVSCYYLADLTVIDQLGLADKYVAHKPPETLNRTNDERYMAHDKQAEPAYLWRRGLNLLIEPAATTRHQALMRAPYALELAEDLWMPLANPRPPDAAVEDPPWIDRAFRGRKQWRLVVDRELGCFRVGADHGWTLEGDAFARGVRDDMPPTRTVYWPTRCDCSHGLSSRDASGEGKGTGRARSPFFRVPAEPAFEVRVAGTPGANVGVRVVGTDGTELGRIKMVDDKWLMVEHLDLSGWVGRDVAVEVFDDSDTGWVAIAGVVTSVPEPLDKP